jgi:hypothetical protein
MRYDQLLGIASISGGSLLLAAVLYDPSEIVTGLGLQQRMSEANVAVLVLLLAAACIVVGFAALRPAPPRAERPKLLTPSTASLPRG